METWPEFVKDGDEVPRHASSRAQLTGWETVVFEVTDDQEEGGSEVATAAIAP